jgi:delta24-sterol reductase
VPGCFTGVGVETSSHIYGLFQHICVAFEVVLPDGSVQMCSRDVHSELFYTIPWSHGTLGFVVSAELKIIPCQKYVRLQYLPFHSRAAAIEQFDKVLMHPLN